MRCANVASGGRRLGFLLVVALWLAPNPALASSWDIEIQAVRRANQALHDLMAARLQLERFHLMQLQQLNHRGQATWIELARQEAQVGRLVVQREALARFCELVERVAGERERLGTIDSELATPLKLTLPGSIRLVGWIEPEDSPRIADHHPQFLAAGLAAGFVPPNDEPVHLATVRLQQAAARFREYDGSGAAPSGWPTHARLLHDVARAEWQLAVIEAELNPDFGTGSGPALRAARHVVAGMADDGGSRFLHARSHADLQQATCAVAWAEARASGALKQAQLELQRWQDKASLIHELVDRGVATRSRQIELYRQVEQARERVEQQRAQMARRMEIAQQLEAGRPGQPDRRPLAMTGDGPTGDPWPRPILDHPARVWHLLELRRKYYELQGQRDAGLVDLEMRQEWLQRLQQARARSAKSPTIVHQQDRLAASLDLGEGRQVTSIETAIQLLEANILDAAEQMAVMTLEERRFMIQCQYQDGLTEWRQVTSPVAFRGVGGTPAGRGALVGRSASYLECETAGPLLYRDLIWDGGSSLAVGRFDFDRKNQLPLLSGGSGPTRLASGSSALLAAIRRPWLDNRALLPSRAGPGLPVASEVPLHGWYVNPPGSWLGTWSSQELYPNGILRGDRRDRIPAGLSPWYLPGNPTNLQK